MSTWSTWSKKEEASTCQILSTCASPGGEKNELLPWSKLPVFQASRDAASLNCSRSHENQARARARTHTHTHTHRVASGADWSSPSAFWAPAPSSPCHAPGHTPSENCGTHLFLVYTGGVNRIPISSPASGPAHLVTPFLWAVNSTPMIRPVAA